MKLSFSKYDWLSSLSIRFVVIILFVLIIDSNKKRTLQQHNQYLFIDNSTACPIYYYSVFEVVRDCSSLNVGRNSSILKTANYDSITKLLLGNNSLFINIPYSEINKYASIKLLNLSFNGLNEFNYDLQLIECQTNHLHELILSYNSFSKIPLLNPGCMQIMQVLTMDHNYLLTFIDDPNMFSNGLVKTMPSLVKLDLSYCNIQTLNSGNFSIFQYFPNLTYLNLIGNQIKFIYQNPFIYLPNLIFLSFELNLIQCDTTHQWLQNYLKMRNFSQILFNGTTSMSLYSPSCFNILTYQNDSILTLDPYLFVSGIFITTRNQNPLNLQALEGNQIDLTCDLYSKPASDLWWTFNNRIISKINAADGPYQFIESFTPNNRDLNKTSTLRIKADLNQVPGNYSCLGYYSNYAPNNISQPRFVNFTLNVNPNPNLGNGGLDAGVIAAIVIGSILAFLLLCLIAFLLIYCCCYRLGICCFAVGSSSDSRKKSSLSVVSMISTDSKKRRISEQEEKAAGFTELSQARPPNYMINTISKSSNNLNIIDCKSNTEIYPDTSSTWRFATNNKNGSNYNLIESNNIQTNGTTNNNFKSNDIYSNKIITNIHQSENLGLQRQINQELIDNQAYDETLLYNVNNPINYNGKYTINKKQQQQQQIQQQHHQQQASNQVYTIKHPIDYGSSYNTNEGYLIENIETLNHQNIINLNNSNLNQAEIMYQQQQLYQQQQQQKKQQNFNGSMSPRSINKNIFQQNQYQYEIGPSININNNDNIIGYQIPIEEENSYSEQINSNKQYIYSSTTYNQNSNMKTFTNEVNSSFAKYDSDV